VHTFICAWLVCVYVYLSALCCFCCLIYRHSNCFGAALVCPVLSFRPVSVCRFQCLINASAFVFNIVYRVCGAANNNKWRKDDSVSKCALDSPTWLRSAHTEATSIAFRQFGSSPLPFAPFPTHPAPALTWHPAAVPLPPAWGAVTCWSPFSEREERSTAHVAVAALSSFPLPSLLALQKL